MRRLAAIAVGLALATGSALGLEPLSVNYDTMTSEYNRGDYLMAEEIGRRILTVQPSNLGVHYLLGNIHVRYGRYDQAMAEYKYCVQHGSGSQIGKNSERALEQISKHRNQQETDKSPTADTTRGVASPLPPTGPAAQAESPDKVDLQTLEYKERLLKEGADLIAANRVKLQRQIEAIQRQAEQAIDDLDDDLNGNGRGGPPGHMQEKQRLQSNAAERIKSLKENAAAEEQKITAYYQAQVDAITARKGDLSSQTSRGNGDVRLEQKGSGLFVRNYINYHGELPPPPPIPELQATARGLQPASARARSKSKTSKHTGATGK
ncbi:MAG: hypothetical protein JSS83_10950 [Cyanobacteria bacterium SZAS LIN-3]|nr:hypothetical protein [Cyanobacteria bacterium SZAS LIN-3]